MFTKDWLERNLPIRIAFFSASTADTDRLQLDEEYRAIDQRLRADGHRELFDLQSFPACRPEDLLRNIARLQPTVVHFSGHGTESGELMLVDDADRPKFAPAASAALDPDTLGLLFRSVRNGSETPLQLVVLNACYSEAQAAVIADHVPVVVGMTGKIGDRSAIKFSEYFYGALADRSTPISRAFEQGIAALGLSGSAFTAVPRLHVREGHSSATLGVGYEYSVPWSEAFVVADNVSTSIREAFDARPQAWIRSEFRTPLINMVTELCFNAFEHGGASECTLGIYNDYLVITDDGGPFHPIKDMPPEAEGIGLFAVGETLSDFDFLRLVHRYWADRNVVTIGLADAMQPGGEGDPCPILISGPFDDSNPFRKIPGHVFSFADGCAEYWLDYRLLGNRTPWSHMWDLLDRVVRQLPENSILHIRNAGDGKDAGASMVLRKLQKSRQYEGRVVIDPPEERD